MAGMYDRIVESIDNGIAQALSRRKGEGIHIGDRKEMTVPEDTHAYEKHSKTYYWLSDFAAGKLQDFKSSRDYDILGDEDVLNLSRIFRDCSDPEIKELTDTHRLLDILEPRRKGDVRKLFLKFPDLSWTRLLKQTRKKENPLWFGITWFDGDGQEHPIWEYVRGDDARFIRFTNPVLGKTDPTTGTDNSIIISSEWESIMPAGKLKWQRGDRLLGELDYEKTFGKTVRTLEGIAAANANEDVRGLHDSWKAVESAANGNEPLHDNWTGAEVDSVRDYLPAICHCIGHPTHSSVRLGNSTFMCFLPAMGQLKVMSDFLDIINKALEMTGSRPLCIDRGFWWSSSECSDGSAWDLKDGKTAVTGKCLGLSVLPVFALDSSGHGMPEL